MSITNEGYQLINKYINIFSFFNENDQINKKYIKQLYENIQYSIEYLNSYNFKENVYKKNIEVNDNNREEIINKMHVKVMTAYNSKHVPNDLKKVIKVCEYSFDINKINFHISFFILKKEDERILDNYVKIMIKNLHFLINFKGINVNSIKFIVLLSNAKKEKNENKRLVLDATNINTGVTLACQKDGFIFLYRKEELIKVFIHEVIHSMCIDFTDVSINNKMIKTLKEMFNVKSDFIINEAYTEFWANIINTLFVSAEISESNFNIFYENFIFLNMMEQIFAMHQLVSVLDYMSLTYEDLINNVNTHKYQENTNIFAYFILKCIWLVNSNFFFKYMFELNKGLITANSNPKNFYKLITKTRNYYKDKKFMKLYYKIQKIYLKLSKKYDYDNIKNSLRMSILEQN